MTSIRYQHWDGHARVGYQVTISVPVNDHDANGFPQIRDITSDTLAVVVTDSEGADVTATVAASAVATFEHIALVTITSANADLAGRHTIDIFIGTNPEPTHPGTSFTMEPA